LNVILCQLGLKHQSEFKVFTSEKKVTDHDKLRKLLNVVFSIKFSNSIWNLQGRNLISLPILTDTELDSNKPFIAYQISTKMSNNGLIWSYLKIGKTNIQKLRPIIRKINTKKREEFQRLITQDQRLQNYQILGPKSKKLWS
jgi:hypothetical protein